MPARWTATTTIVVEANGGNWAQSTMAAADDLVLSPGNTCAHPYGKFTLSANFESTASMTTPVTIYMYFSYGDGTNYESSPSISHKYTYVGSFNPPHLYDALSDYYMVIEAVPLPIQYAKVSLWNGTAVEISASWVLKCVPYSLTAA